MDMNAGQLTRQIYSRLMQWTNGAYEESWTFFSTTVRNADIHHVTNQPSIIKSCRLTFFGHLARMDENADASQAIFEPPPENWRRPPGQPSTTWMKNIYDDLYSLDLEIYEARDLAQN